MKLGELLVGLDDAALRNGASGDLDVQRLRADSRQLAPGDVFFAIPGVQTDGFKYIAEAVASGVALVVAERETDIDIPLVLVPDARIALALMAANYYGKPAADLRMIGVTGTNGKTTVTHILKGLFDRLFPRPCGLIGTNAILIGDRRMPSEFTSFTTPDAVDLQVLFREMADAGCERCVMEVSSQALTQRRTWGIQYHRAVFTNLSQDHLDYHRDMEEYFAAKAQLFAQADLGIVNIDDEYGLRLAERPGSEAVTYSARHDRADVTAKNIKLKSNRVEFEAVTQLDIARIEWATPGAFSVYNALAAVTTALSEGISLGDIATAIRDVPPVTGRMEVVPGPPGVTVIIDYAHTPDALANVISTMKSHSGRLITLFGCGGDRDRAKRPLMAQAAARDSSLLVVTSDNPRTEEPSAIIEDILSGIPKNAPPVKVEADRASAIELALLEAKPGDTVLLCGKGHETYQEVHGTRRPMDERKIVSGIINR
ncbi:MAG: UDP-N-acetylmuramoyl-L-alanyl-D-glutamate--2,6-diaminopimelate ligase [Oscillospiraceae bacterium]|nr:UDP-N-acetylmuramoyl-L-alanyl-D-glutamate--2,6-diaminopimelate ligase [Oscillospiraceae bacterium]